MYRYENVKSQAKEHGLQIKDIAEKLGITKQGFIYSYCGKSANGKYTDANPSIKSLEKLADAIGCTVSDFLEEQPEPKATLVCPKCGMALNVKLEAE